VRLLRALAGAARRVGLFRVGQTEDRDGALGPFGPHVVGKADKVEAPERALGRRAAVSVSKPCCARSNRGLARMVARKSSDTTADGGEGEAASAPGRGGVDRCRVGSLKQDEPVSLKRVRVRVVRFVLLG
jgi:hypothetical protein